MLLCAALTLPAGSLPAVCADVADSTAEKLAEAGFLNVRAASTDEFRAYSVETDFYKLPVEGLGAVRDMIERSAAGDMRPVKIVATMYDVPEVTMTYDPSSGLWNTTKRLDSSWDALRGGAHKRRTKGKERFVRL